MAHGIAVANQKGGVGKTTSSVSIAAELALNGKRTLLIDFDPQGSATSGVGLDLPEEGEDLFDFFFGKVSLSKIITPTQIQNLDVAPASRDLVGVEIEVGKAPGRELILKSGLKEVSSRYDYIVIDCPPSSGLLTLNALGAVNKVLIPLQAEYYALEGITALMKTIEFVQQTFNPSLEILGVFITMFDSRTNLSTQVVEEAKNFFKEKLFRSVVPRSVKLAESPSHGKPIALYDRGSTGGRAYMELALEIIEKFEAKPMPQAVGA